jgi:F0F1-type ATP synthase assembly protein I
MNQTRTKFQALGLGAVLITPALVGALLDYFVGSSPMFLLIGSTITVLQLVERTVNRVGTAATKYSKPDIDNCAEERWVS